MTEDDPVASGGTADLRYLFVAGREVVRDGRIPQLDVLELDGAAARPCEASWPALECQKGPPSDPQ